MTDSNLQAQNADFLYMIEQATKAPSGHNTQPWLFKIGEKEIEICPNDLYKLAVVDPYNRELFVSLGCATENLCIAATTKGYDTMVSVAANGIITVHLEKNENVIVSPLASQINIRQTTRRQYDGRLIARNALTKLRKMICEPEVQIHYFERGTPEFDSIAQYVYRGNELQMNDMAFIKELMQWMRYNKKDQDNTRDGLSYAVFGAPNLPRSIAKFIISKSINPNSQNKTDRKNISSSSHLVLFTTRHNTLQEWISLGRTLERFLLLSTSNGILNAYLNQPNEVSALSIEMINALHLKNEVPTILIRIGYGKRCSYSLRRNVEEVLLSDRIEK